MLISIRSIRTFVLAASSSLLLAACSGHKGLNVPDAPDWVNFGTSTLSADSPNMLHGVGMSQSMQNTSLQLSVADNRARAELGRILSTVIDASMKDFSSNNDGTETMNIQSELNTQSQATLNGAKIIERWKNPQNGDVYALAQLDLKSIENMIERASMMNASQKTQLKSLVQKNMGL